MAELLSAGAPSQSLPDRTVAVADLTDAELNEARRAPAGASATHSTWSSSRRSGGGSSWG